jgi:hypothetical protein
MAYIQSFEIGTTYGGRVNVESLSTTPNMGPRSKFLAYSESVMMASGVSVGRGAPSAIWTWGFIPNDMHTALRAICAGASVAVIIRTLQADYATYTYYSGIMTWPVLDSYEFRSGRRQDFEIVFEKLTVYTP